MLKQTILLPEVIIDSHCHGRDLEEQHKTTIAQTLLEAAKGLINITVFMPNTLPAITSTGTLFVYFDLIDRAVKKQNIKYKQYVYFGLTDENFNECAQAIQYSSVVGIKVYPKSKSGKTVTTGSIGVVNENTILSVMELVRSIGKVLAVHCDDPEIIRQYDYIIKAEVEYVKKIIRLARAIPGVKVIICHVSCRQSAELILEAQSQGMRIAMELMPHYLWFDKDGTNWNPELNPIFYHCYNNLRGREHREYLVNLLASKNPLIWVASDTACHTKNKKIEKKLGGIPSNQETVAVIVTLASQLGLSDEQVARLISWNASDFFNIPVSRNLAEYKIEKRIDDLQYNNGRVVNPWNGSELLFPVKI